jgi:hypothetical protein
VVATIAILVGLGPVAAARAAGESSAKQIIADVSGERHFASIPPVNEDHKLSAGCAAHTHYLALNGFGADPHREIKGRPGYTPAGAKAASQSVLAEVGASGGSPWRQSDPFDLAPYHLFLLMDPVIETMGADELITPSGSAFECVNVLGGKRRAPGRHMQEWEFPGPGPVPNIFTFFEGPFAGRPTGVWLFFYVLPPRGVHVTLTTAGVTGPHNRKVTPLATFVAGGLRDGRRHHSRLRHGPIARSANLSSGWYSPEPAGGELMPITPYGLYLPLWILDPPTFDAPRVLRSGFQVSG